MVSVRRLRDVRLLYVVIVVVVVDTSTNTSTSSGSRVVVLSSHPLPALFVPLPPPTFLPSGPHTAHVAGNTTHACTSAAVSVHVMNNPNFVKKVTVHPSKNKAAPTVVLHPDATLRVTAVSAPRALVFLHPSSILTYAPATCRM